MWPPPICIICLIAFLDVLEEEKMVAKLKTKLRMAPLPSPTPPTVWHAVPNNVFLGLGGGVDGGGRILLNINVNVKTTSDVLKIYRFLPLNQIQLKPHESLGDHQCKQSSQPPENQIILEFGNNWSHLVGVALKETPDVPYKAAYKQI